METNEKTANAAMTKALIKVQQHVLTAKKDGKNPMFNSRYATLDSVLDAIREPLSANGFALVQEATTGDNMSVSVVTRLLHDSGGELASPPLTAPLRKEFNKAGVELPPSVQQIGSVVTYLRRYSLCPFLGVSAEDDDDGNGASDSGKNAPAAEKTHTSEKTKPAASSPMRSAHTGETLDSAEAIARHKAAAEKAKPADAEPSKRETAPAQAKPEDDSAVNPKLAAAMMESRITIEGLTGYLKGEMGKPRITKPLLVGSMTADSLGEKIVDALLAPKNWGMVVERITADPNYLPF